MKTPEEQAKRWIGSIHDRAWRRASEHSQFALGSLWEFQDEIAAEIRAAVGEAVRGCAMAECDFCASGVPGRWVTIGDECAWWHTRAFGACGAWKIHATFPEHFPETKP